MVSSKNGQPVKASHDVRNAYRGQADRRRTSDATDPMSLAPLDAVVSGMLNDARAEDGHGAAPNIVDTSGTLSLRELGPGDRKPRQHAESGERNGPNMVSAGQSPRMTRTTDTHMSESPPSSPRSGSDRTQHSRSQHSSRSSHSHHSHSSRSIPSDYVLVAETRYYTIPTGSLPEIPLLPSDLIFGRRSQHRQRGDDRSISSSPTSPSVSSVSSLTSTTTSTTISSTSQSSHMSQRQSSRRPPSSVSSSATMISGQESRDRSETATVPAVLPARSSRAATATERTTSSTARPTARTSGTASSSSTQAQRPRPTAPRSSAASDSTVFASALTTPEGVEYEVVSTDPPLYRYIVERKMSNGRPSRMIRSHCNDEALIGYYIAPPTRLGAVPDKFYVITRGHNVGVYDNWHLCKHYVLKPKGAAYSGHSTREAAVSIFKEALEFGAVEEIPWPVPNPKED